MSDDPLDLAPIPSDARRTPSPSPDPVSLGPNAPSSSRARRDRPPVDYSLKLLLPPAQPSRLSAADKGKGRASTSMARDVLKRSGPSNKRKSKKSSSGSIIKPKSTEPPDPECGFCGSVENPCVVLSSLSSDRRRHWLCSLSFATEERARADAAAHPGPPSGRATLAAGLVTTTACSSRASSKNESKPTSGNALSASNARSAASRRTSMSVSRRLPDHAAAPRPVESRELTVCLPLHVPAQPERLLFCDQCDRGYHIDCLSPVSREPVCGRACSAALTTRKPQSALGPASGRCVPTQPCPTGVVFRH